jgi:hypothetical protein
MAGIILAGDQQDGNRRGLSPKPGGEPNGQDAQRERIESAKSWFHGPRLASSHPGDNPNQILRRGIPFRPATLLVACAQLELTD